MEVDGVGDESEVGNEAFALIVCAAAAAAAAGGVGVD